MLNVQSETFSEKHANDLQDIIEIRNVWIDACQVHVICNFISYELLYFINTTHIPSVIISNVS